MEQKKPRCTEFELMKRVSEVYKLLLAGKCRRDIIEEIGAKYDVVAGTVDYYITKARAEFQDVILADIEEKKMLASARYEDLYAKSMEAGDYRAARGVLDSLSKLQGLMTDKLEVSVPSFDVKWS